MADPTGKAARVARSRAACSACRSTKQVRALSGFSVPYIVLENDRVAVGGSLESYIWAFALWTALRDVMDRPGSPADAASSSYGLECEYPPSSGPTASKPAAARPPTTAYNPPPPSPDVEARLREIAERLRSIESSLAGVHLDGNSGPHSTTSIPSYPHPRNSEPESPASSGSNSNDIGQVVTNMSSNPLQTVNETVDAIEALAKEKFPAGFLRTTTSSLEWGGVDQSRNTSNGVSRLFAGVPPPDVFHRGVMTQEESPWAPIFDLERDRSAAEMRERSPLLFHVMLLCTAYYLMGSSERGQQVYYALTGLVNELLAPLILSAQPHQVNTDFVRALCLLLLWKPVQHASLFASGITDPDAQEAAAKVNAFSSSILGGLMIRTAFAISLPSITSTFAKSFSPTIPIPHQVCSDLRLWFWICVVDTHGAMTTGRAGSADIQDALRITRLFSSLKLQKYDTRLAAMVELYATAKFTVLGTWTSGARSIAPHELRRFNKEVDEWEDYWKDPLKAAASDGDSLAYHSIVVSGNFIRLVVNSSVFTRWRAERNHSLSRGGSGRPPLTTEDWSFLLRAVKAAEAVAFSLCVESRVEGGLNREVNWPSKEATRPRPLLTLDPNVVDVHRTAFDTIATVVYTFSLIFLARMANTGLIRCELVVLVDEYEGGLTVDNPQRLLAGCKLGRLLELGSAFLDVIAPTPSHPAKKQSRMLKAIYTAGTVGQVIPANLDPSEPSHSPVAPRTPSSLPGSSGDLHATSPVGYAVSMSPSSTSTAPIQQSFVLPPLSTPQYDQAFTGRDTIEAPAGVAATEPGLALASILGGISPSFFGDLGFFNEMWSNGGDINGIEGMSVDWDQLELSMANQSSAPPPPLPPIDSYFSSR
ncbi:hypothetical protein P7C70_g3504, partial [Phenoliferia sp. Uapishka_3]